MPLVNGAVGTKEIEITLAVNIPQKDTLPFAQYNWKGMVVVRTILIL